MDKYLKTSLIHWLIALAICLWWLSGCAPTVAIEGNCVPRAFFNAMAWGVENKCPVYVADFAGHWQAVGEFEGELHFLRGEHWQVWPGEKEGNKPMVKLWNLRDAMDHYIRHNSWTMPNGEEMKRLNERVEKRGGERWKLTK